MRGLGNSLEYDSSFSQRKLLFLSTSKWATHTQKTPQRSQYPEATLGSSKIKKSNPYSQLLVNYYEEHALITSRDRWSPTVRGWSLFFFPKAQKEEWLFLSWTVIVKHPMRVRDHGNMAMKRTTALTNENRILRMESDYMSLKNKGGSFLGETRTKVLWTDLNTNGWTSFSGSKRSVSPGRCN